MILIAKDVGKLGKCKIFRIMLGYVREDIADYLVTASLAFFQRNVFKILVTHSVKTRLFHHSGAIREYEMLT